MNKKERVIPAINTRLGSLSSTRHPAHLISIMILGSGEGEREREECPPLGQLQAWRM